MRFTRLFFVFVFCFFAISSFSLLSLYAASPTGPCEYTPITSYYTNLNLGLSYDYSSDQYVSTEGDVHEGDFQLNYLRLYDSPSTSFRLSSDSSISFEGNDSTYQVGGSGSYNVYLTETDLFGFGGLGTEATSEMAGVWGLNFQSGLGLGRFKNVTPMTKALRINDALIEEDAIRGILPRATIVEVADVIAEASPDPDLVDLLEDIEQTVEDTGQLKGQGLGAVALLKVREILAYSDTTRLCGFETRAGLGYEVLDPGGEGGNFTLNVSLDYALPYDPNTQSRISCGFQIPLDLSAEYSLTGLLNYTYQISSDVDAELTYTFSQRLRRDKGETVSHAFDLDFDLWLQSDLKLTTSLYARWETGYEELAHGLSINLEYDVL